MRTHTLRNVLPPSTQLQQWVPGVALFAGMLAVAGAEPSLPAAAKLNRIPGTRYELHDVVREYVDAVTQNWLLTMPDRNPAILQMFADRDKEPHRDLLVWSGEFAGKYLTGATQVWRLTQDPKLKDCLSKFATSLVQLQTEDGYLGPCRKDVRLNWGWDVWGHYHAMLGLLLWHEDTRDPQALQCAVKIGDLLCRKFLHSTERIVDGGGVEMNHAAVHSLCLLYEATKTPAYLELARQIVDEEFPHKGAGDFVRRRLKARNSTNVPSRAGKACIQSRASQSSIESPAMIATVRLSSIFGGASQRPTATTTADFPRANRRKGTRIIAGRLKPAAPSPGSQWEWICCD